MALSEYAYTPMERKKVAALVLAGGWAILVSDYMREVATKTHSTNGDGEVLIIFAVYGLFLWWLSVKKAGGWTAYWTCFLIVSFSPFADFLHGAIGGTWGLAT